MIPSPPSVRKPLAAFTLVELMVSITILTMIVIMFSQSLSSITSAWTNAQEKMDNFSKARTMLNRLQVDLQNVVARQDLPNFGLDGDKSVFGFYTLQRGFGDGTDNTRSLSYVEYTRLDRRLAGKEVPVVERTTKPYSYESGDSPDFLPAPIPVPGASPTPATPPPAISQDGTFDKFDALQGVLAFRAGYLHPDGKYSDNYYEDSSGQPSRAVAVTVGLVVADNKTIEALDRLNRLPGLVSELEIASITPNEPNWSPKSIWDAQLRPRPGQTSNALNRDTYGANFLDSIRTFERTFPLPSSI